MSSHHIKHFYELNDETFSSLWRKVVLVAGDQIPLFEKTDGFRITCRANGNQIVFGRSISDMSSGGMQPDDFVGRFSASHVDEAAVKATTALKRAFDEGKIGFRGDVTFNCDVMCPEVRNVLHYTTRAIVIHEHVDFVVGEDVVIDDWHIRGPIRVALNLSDSQKMRVIEDLKQMAGLPVQSAMSERDPTVHDYVATRLITWLRSNGFAGYRQKEFAHRILNHRSDVMSLTDIKKTYPRSLHGSISQLAKSPSKAIRWARAPLEKVIVDVGNTILENVNSALIDDPLSERTRLKSVISELHDKLICDSEKRNKYADMLNNVKHLHVVEGIVFRDCDVMLKLTGDFSNLNCVAGAWRHNR